MKKQTDNVNELYTSKETRELLGASSSTLASLVEKGLIEKVTPPGKKHGFYTKVSVDRYHDQQIAFKKTYTLKSDEPPTQKATQHRGIEFREATIDDIELEAQLAGLVFGERAEAQGARKAFVRANPHSDYHLYDQGKLVAYIDLIPLKHDAIMDYIEGRVIVWDITPENIEPFEPGKPVECLIADMITSPMIPLVRRVYYGRRLLRGLLEKLVEMGRQGIQISKIYAGSGPKTPLGLRIIGHAGFKEIYRRGEGRVMFELDMMNTDKKFLRQYQEVIKQWKKGQR
jgi:hypothetical protein